MMERKTGGRAQKQLHRISYRQQMKSVLAFSLAYNTSTWFLSSILVFFILFRKLSSKGLDARLVYIYVACASGLGLGLLSPATTGRMMMELPATRAPCVCAIENAIKHSQTQIPPKP